MDSEAHLSSVESVKNALELQPNSLELLSRLAQLYLQQDDFEEAAEVYQRVIALPPAENLWQKSRNSQRPKFLTFSLIWCIIVI